MTCAAVGSVATTFCFDTEITFVATAATFATVVTLVAGQVSRFHIAIVTDIATLCGQNFAANRVAAIALVSAHTWPPEFLIDVIFPPHRIDGHFFDGSGRQLASRRIQHALRCVHAFLEATNV